MKTQLILGMMLLSFGCKQDPAGSSVKDANTDLAEALAPVAEAAAEGAILSLPDTAARVRESADDVSQQIAALAAHGSDFLTIEAKLGLLVERVESLKTTFAAQHQSFGPLAQKWSVRNLKCRAPGASADHEVWAMQSDGTLSNGKPGQSGHVTYSQANQAMVVTSNFSAGNFTKRVSWIDREAFFVRFSDACQVTFQRTN